MNLLNTQNKSTKEIDELKESLQISIERHTTQSDESDKQIKQLNNRIENLQNELIDLQNELDE